MIYVVYYIDDEHRRHMTFVHSYYEIIFLKERFGEVTIESYKITTE